MPCLSKYFFSLENNDFPLSFIENKTNHDPILSKPKLCTIECDSLNLDIQKMCKFIKVKFFKY